MNLAKLFQRNITPIFELKRTDNNLEEILEKYKILLHIPSTVIIKIKFGRKAKRVLGSVRLKNNISIIYISKYLLDFNVPDFVLDEVILHELIHIKTGHGSTLEKTSTHAHRGGVIKKEMAAIGMENIYVLSQAWIKKNWYTHIKNFNRKERILNKT